MINQGVIVSIMPRGQRDTDWRCACLSFNRATSSVCAKCGAIPDRRLTRKLLREKYLDNVTMNSLDRKLGTNRFEHAATKVL